MIESKTELKAYAKINLGLDVVGRREDGYHLVRMIMQSVDIYDTLTLEKRSDDEVHFSCSDTALEGDDNLCVKAVRQLSRALDRSFGVDIFLKKDNPVAAGMGGGSTDAAAVLRGLNELYELGLSPDRLREIAVDIGADVPFCIEGGCALCEGIGEVITPISGMPQMRVVVARPGVAVSTAGIYGRYDEIGDVHHPDIDALRGAIESGDAAGIGGNLGNVLELVTGRDVPEISEIEDIMMGQGALGSVMTGSGPTVFGLFADEDAADRCVSVLKAVNKCSFLDSVCMCGGYYSERI